MALARWLRWLSQMPHVLMRRHWRTLFRTSLFDKRIRTSLLIKKRLMNEEKVDGSSKARVWACVRHTEWMWLISNELDGIVHGWAWLEVCSFFETFFELFKLMKRAFLDSTVYWLMRLPSQNGSKVIYRVLHLIHGDLTFATAAL